MLSNVVTELKSFDVNAEEEKVFSDSLRRVPIRSLVWKAKYDRAETNVNKICEVLRAIRSS